MELSSMLLVLQAAARSQMRRPQHPTTARRVAQEVGWSVTGAGYQIGRLRRAGLIAPRRAGDGNRVPGVALTLAGWLAVCPAPWPELVTSVGLHPGGVEYRYDEECEHANEH